MSEIVLNGDSQEIGSGETLHDLLARLDLDPRWIVAELNGEPVARGQFAEVTLAAGDRLELVRPVAGG